jgi:hypothetical protein
MPPGVRRGLCPAVAVVVASGYAPGAGFAPFPSEDNASSGKKSLMLMP